MMIGYLDFLVAVDEHLEDDNLGYVMDATGLLAIARAALLVTDGDLMTVARWAGQCVERRYLDHAPPSGLDPQPLPPPRMWSEQDLYRLHDFGVTYEGRMEADRVRRRRRENLTDAALAGISARLLKALPQEQRSALQSR